MKILITGAAGFIGSHIQDAYIQAGHEVAVVDNLITGTEKNLNSQSKFYKIDICSKEVQKVIEDFQPDILNHHAAQMDVRKSVIDPQYDSTVNILGFINLLENARKFGVKKVVFASTGGAIYGEQDYFPADESHPLRPASPYGLSKMVGEEYLKLYHRLYELPYVVLRYANIYGPRQNPHGEAGVVAVFCKKMINGETVTINGDGAQTRDYVYVQDVVKANLFALRSEVNGIFNVGTGIETSVNELFKDLAKTSHKSKVDYGPAKVGEQKRSVISSDKAFKQWGWRPCIPIAEGLETTFAWFKET